MRTKENTPPSDSQIIHILLVNLYLWIPAAAPAFSQNNEAVEHPARQIINQVITSLSQNTYQHVVDRFDERLSEELTLEGLQKSWQELLKNVGEFKQLEQVAIEEKNDHHIVEGRCRFETAHVAVKLVLDLENRITGLWFVPVEVLQGKNVAYRMPAYVRPELFEEKMILVGEPPWELTGMLCLPTVQNDLPAVILVAGLGPHDADMSTDELKPFRDLAWGLASRGVITLRYANRHLTYTEELEKINQRTVQHEIIADCLAAIQALREQSAMSNREVIALGHAFGGSMIPRILKQDPSIGGGIILAGVARSLEEALLAERIRLASRDGRVDETESSEIEDLRERVQYVRSESLTVKSSLVSLPLNRPSSFWLDLRVYRPHELAQTIDRPLLILQGGRDVQTTLEDFRIWTDALRGRPTVSRKLYLHLEHYFMVSLEVPATTSADNDSIAANVSEVVIDDIFKWLQEVRN